MIILLIGVIVWSIGVLLTRANKPVGEVMVLVGAGITLLGAAGIFLHLLPSTAN